MKVSLKNHHASSTFVGYCLYKLLGDSFPKL